jgi:LacI family transcriptional regulator
MTTIHELAARSGVSVATVSRALNGSTEVSETTRKRILALAEELNYTPSAAARTLVQRRSHMIGVILETGPGHPDLLHPFFQEVLVGLKQGAGARGYDLLLFASDEPGHGFGTHSFLRRADHHGVDGAIVLGYDGNPEIAKLAESGLPCITVDADIPGPRTGYVMSENREGAALAVRHLVELGHERIATITGMLNTRPGADRLEGYREELARAGLEPREEYVAEGDYYDESGYRATQRLLQLEEPPSAIFAASDLMAAGALRAANELGVRVPDDLAIVGFDDIGLASLIQPQLTTVRQDMHALGEAAAEGLSRTIENSDAERVERFVPTRLVIRASSGVNGAPRGQARSMNKEVG